MVRTGPLPEAADKLISLAQSRMREVPTGRPNHPDDLTFIVFRPNVNGIRERRRQFHMPFE